ncbi:MAG: tyrosine-type recombinase/integrase [Solirubrobacteraceae bacterium]
MPAQDLDLQASISGHVWLYEGKRRKTWYAKWRDQAGQHEKALGPHWSGKGTPPPGFLRKREAEALLAEILVEARRGQLRQQRTGLTFAALCEEWYEYGCYQRDWSPATRRDYRSVLDAHLIPAFGPKRPEAITGRDVEKLRDRLACESTAGLDGEPAQEVRTRRTVNKIMTQLHGVLQFAVRHHKLLKNVCDAVDLLEDSYDAARYDFYSPQEIDLIYSTALAGGQRNPKRPAKSPTEQALREEEDHQDATIYLTAALTGLRLGELTKLLHWDDIDFEKACIRVWETPRAKDRRHGNAERPRKPKSRKSRTVPMVDRVAKALQELKQRDHHTDRTDLVFISRYDGPLDSSALRRRYNATLKATGLRRLRIHDLRHTFGSLAINVASIVQVQAWMGHADIKTTMRYLHHKSRADDARLLSAAFVTDAQ